MKHLWVRVAALGVAAILLTAAYRRTEQSSVMADAAQAFLNSLWSDQKAKATYKFEDDERFDWHFIPKLRKGLSFGEMQPFQQKLATALLASGLSQQGLIKAETIMSLDQVLLLLEQGAGPNRRDPNNYYVTIFGTPSATGTWGYRVEGHHLSQNYTIVNGKIADSPSFFGSNPAEVRVGPRKGLRVLAAEDDYGYDLIDSLDNSQKETAVVDKTAYKDIISFNSRKAALSGQPNGLQASKMNAAQYDKLMALIEVYADNMPEQIAQHRMEMAKKQPKDATYFAWSGVTQRGGPHYYRVQTPAFLIELDETQDNANHIHSVWRDYENDFGLDLLKMHYQASHNVK
ncbi:MAG TPA: DUF3500 domain-containing protein [Bryobacteraceae bacterium]|jgi:hypothetical protein|nr:DUF3500 domain-containing protein [Bryobacteraceae bacterium]